MSLKAIAKQELARLKAGEMVHETERETRLKQVKQPVSCFIDAGARFIPVKHVERRETAKNEACFTVSSPKGETRETSLPDDVAAGIRRLKVMRAPRLQEPGMWAIAVAGAAYLVKSVWAAKALALGWSLLDLFGAVPDRDGDPAGDGLAVWLAGRKLLAITAEYAVVEDVGGGRSYFNRRTAPGAALLWALTSEDKGNRG